VTQLPARSCPMMLHGKLSADAADKEIFSPQVAIVCLTDVRVGHARTRLQCPAIVLILWCHAFVPYNESYESYESSCVGDFAYLV
jgi:hypothetical protein